MPKKRQINPNVDFNGIPMMMAPERERDDRVIRASTGEGKCARGQGLPLSWQRR
jgi:hypothetical protein